MIDNLSLPSFIASHIRDDNTAPDMSGLRRRGLQAKGIKA
jgi:hypothetical protein